MTVKNGDPVHKNGGRWWFWDEVWVERHGPYATKAEAKAACARYAEWLEKGAKTNGEATV